ncbi:MAG: hypothetical protein EOO14_05275 [Chitinophagaceae bacterium]|nr:MAG: hypothetical protein EOO14_05275 [Chitinophagaceae bacterium]
MRKLLFVLSAVAIVSVSCQKENSLELPDSSPGTGGGNNATGQLVRMVLVSGTDSLAYDFSYDVAGRLGLIKASAANYNETIRFQRDASGIIKNIIQKNTGLLSGGIDSVDTRYYYNAAQGGYTAGVFEMDIQGATYIDSTTFTYDGSGKLSSRTSYAGGIGVPFELSSKLDYTLTALNMNSVKSYSYNRSNWDLDYTINFSYDNKTNPLHMGIETLLIDPYISPAFGLNASIYFGANNVTFIDYIDPNDPADSYNIRTTYTYNNLDKPTGGTAIESNFTSFWRFYYN